MTDEMIKYYRRDYEQQRLLERIEILLTMIYNNTRPEGTKPLPLPQSSTSL